MIRSDLSEDSGYLPLAPLNGKFTQGRADFKRKGGNVIDIMGIRSSVAWENRSRSGFFQRYFVNWHSLAEKQTSGKNRVQCVLDYKCIFDGRIQYFSERDLQAN